jgi:DNA-binding PucR family transcriptional regulator
VKTFRYRLRRIAELSDIHLTDPEERLAVHLELRLKDA